MANKPAPPEAEDLGRGAGSWAEPPAGLEAWICTRRASGASEQGERRAQRDRGGGPGSTYSAGSGVGLNVEVQHFPPEPGRKEVRAA